MMKPFYTLFFVLLLALPVSAQTVPQSLAELALKSEYIFEGKVIRSDSYWNQDENFIYTSHTIELSKIFKGDLQCGTVEVLTVGGMVNDKEITGSHTLNLYKGEIGTFCTIGTTYELPAIDYYSETNSPVLNVINEEQGFFKYQFDDINPVCSNPIYQFDSLQQVYDSLQIALQISYIDCNTSTLSQQIDDYEVYRKKPRTVHRAIPYISYVTPNKGYGGIGQVITVYGGNFGNNPINGRIFLPNANRFQFWGAEYVALNNNVDVLYWSDTIIEFILPSITRKIDTTITGLTFSYVGVPGTGIIVIQNDLGDISDENDPVGYIDIPYAVAARVEFDSVSQTYSKPRIKSIDSNPSIQRYVFHVDNYIKSSPIILAIVQRAINDWACYSNAYYRLDTTQLATSSAYDHINSITFGSTPGNVPGVTYNTAIFCSADQSLPLDEIDIIFEKDSVVWWNSLNPLDLIRPFGKVDFYQAVLHELGHSHMIYHVVDSGSLMFRDQGYLRNIDLLEDSSAVGGLVALNFSLNNPPIACGFDAPYLENCPTLSMKSKNNEAELLDIYPNPLIENVLSINIKRSKYDNYLVALYDVYGEKVLEKNIAAGNQEPISIDIGQLPQGVYTISVTSPNYFATQKLIKL